MCDGLPRAQPVLVIYFCFVARAELILLVLIILEQEEFNLMSTDLGAGTWPPADLPNVEGSSKVWISGGSTWL